MYVLTNHNELRVWSKGSLKSDTFAVVVALHVGQVQYLSITEKYLVYAR